MTPGIWITAVVAGVALTLVGFGVLGVRSRRRSDTLVERIDALLPQTQCEQCSYPGCRPYAQAMARGDADINRCPPGGQDTADALARLLGRAPAALATGPAFPGTPPVALIDEDVCIGCALCIKACPVDAIVGAAKRMHTVIASECTGCELCIAPCPVDCISLEPRPANAHLPIVGTCA